MRGKNQETEGRIRRKKDWLRLLLVLGLLGTELAGLVSGNLLVDSLSSLGSVELGSSELLGLDLPLGGVLLGGLEDGVLSDSGVSVSVDLLNVIGSNTVREVSGELLLESLVILLLEGLHVLGNVTTDDVLLENFWVELLSLDIETGESLLAVRNEDTTVRGTLESTKDSVTSGRSLETDIEEDLERSGLVVTLEGLSEGHLSIGLSDTLVLVGEAKSGQDSSGTKETGSVGSGPVGETVLDTVLVELVGRGVSDNVVTLDLGVDNLDNDLLVGESDDKSVLGGVVLVLGLGNQTLSGVVVGLTLTSSSGLR